MKNTIKVNDWVEVKVLGVNGLYQVTKIENGKYTVELHEGSYVHRLVLPVNKLRKV